jgi:hypothetical protein
MLGFVLSVSAGALPSGSAPPTAPIPAGLNPGGPQYPFPNGGAPVAVGQILTASGGPVYVTDLGPTGASFDEQIFVASPNDGFNGLFMDDHSTLNGTTYSLGTFPAGTEIEIGLEIIDSGGGPNNPGGLPADQIWYTGPGSRNSDGTVRAYMQGDYEGLTDTTYVGFEDYIDFNYVDEVFAFTGTVSTPDLPGTLPLLGLGLSGLAAFGRRFRK